MPYDIPHARLPVTVLSGFLGAGNGIDDSCEHEQQTGRVPTPGDILDTVRTCEDARVQAV